jgi:hypothetical protein
LVVADGWLGVARSSLPRQYSSFETLFGSFFGRETGR